MYLRNLSESLLRRWYLVVVGLCVVAALAAVTYVKVPPTYEANANVVLLPPKTTVVEGGNPYLYLGGLSQALDVLTRSIDGDTTREGILGGRKDIDYAVEPDRTTAGPILVIQATGPTVKDTLTVLNAVLDAVPVNLRKLQDDLQVTPTSQITSMTLTVDQKPTVVGKDRLRAVIGVAGIGAAGMALLIGAIDGFLLSRARRKGRVAEARPVAAAAAEASSFDEIIAPRRDGRSSAPEASRTL